MADPKNIVNEIEIDCSKIEKGYKFYVNDINFPEGMSPVYYKDGLIATLLKGKAAKSEEKDES